LTLLDAEQRRSADQAVLQQLKSLTTKQVARFEARRAIVMAWYTYIKLHGMRGTIKLYDAFVSHFNEGNLQDNQVIYPHLDDAVSGVIHSIARRTLQMWVSEYEKPACRRLSTSWMALACAVSARSPCRKICTSLLSAW
jgi:hypothetical protein